MDVGVAKSLDDPGFICTCQLRGILSLFGLCFLSPRIPGELWFELKPDERYGVRIPPGVAVEVADEKLKYFSRLLNNHKKIVWIHVNTMHQHHDDQPTDLPFVLTIP